MSIDSISNVYASVRTKNNFGKLHGVLKSSNYENLLYMTTDVEVLKENFFGSKDIKKIGKKEEFYHLITYMFQSLTNIGYTTFEIIKFIVEALADSDLKETEKTEIVDFLTGSFCFVHTDYSATSLWTKSGAEPILKKILFGHASKDYFNMGLVLGPNSAVVIGKNPKFKKDIKTLSAFTGVTSPKYNQVQNYNRLVRSFNSSSLNSNVENPSKSKTSVSSILVTDPRIRVGTQNHLELSTFFNGLTTLEMNRSYPYVNATFILPTLAKQRKVKGNLYEFTAKSSTISSFMFSGENKTKNYDRMGGDSVGIGIRKTNMSLFTMPQTAVNLDEPIGHNQNNSTNSRLNTVNDPTQPFMTITGFNINTAPTKGLMSYKTGTLNVILHDRTRMPEIAPFVKPDLLGSFGAEIIIEYGWSNPDQDNPKNVMGYFIGNSRIVEKYMIVNSSMSIDNNGQVNISLSLATKGPHEFKNQKISTKVAGRVTESEFRKLVGELNYNRLSIIGNNNKYLENFKINAGMYEDIFSETSRISTETMNSLKNFVNIHRIMLRNTQGSLKDVKVNLINSNQEFNIEISGTYSSILGKMFSSLSNSEINKKTKNGVLTLNFKNNNKMNSPEIFYHLQEIYNTVSNICDYITYISRQDKSEGDNQKKIIETIMGSAQYIDHFYPTDNVLYPTQNPTNYVSFGSVVNTIIQSFIANKTSSFDEIQTVFYNANEYAGKMANRNLANFLIPRKMLSNLLENIFNNNVVITPESLISQIIIKCMQRKDNISLGLTDLYENPKNDPSKPVEIKQTIKDNNTFTSTMNSNLKKIYGLPSNFPNEDLKFVLPVIHMNFDCLTSNSLESSSKERTILRVSIFDKADSPFQSSSEILENIYSGKINKVIGSIAKNREDHNNQRSKNKYNRKSIEKFHIKHNNEIKKLISKNLIKVESSGYKINSELFLQNNSKFVGDVKSIYKRIYPSLTYGMQNSVLLSANVSTMNENKLSTIFITRSDRNDQSLINNRINEEMPLLIMPTQATVEIFGCPWVNFGQSVFLDFETGTTLDNKYVVTGITHNLSPGKFSTQLTLTYADNYGQLRNADALLNDMSNHSDNKKRKRPSTRASKTGNVTLTIKPNYTDSPDHRDLFIPQ